MNQELEEKSNFYYFNSDRICSVVDNKNETTTEEDKFQDYQCHVCYDISLDILECKSCETIFCNRCINQIKQKKKDQICTCPNNCSVWVLNKPHRSIRNFIENIEFYCKYYQLGCRQKLKLNNVFQHESVDCDFIIIQCKNKGCQIQVPLKTYQQHIDKECQFRKIKCDRCDFDYVLCEQQNHDCIQSLKKEIASLKLQISTMYTKEQLDKLFQDFVEQSESQTALENQQNQNVNKEYNYPSEEEINQQIEKKNKEQEEKELQNGEQDEESKQNFESKEQNENQEESLKKIFESGIQMIRNKYENQIKQSSIQSQLQNYQQSQINNIPVYPPAQYPPSQSQVYPPQQYPPIQSQVQYPPPPSYSSTFNSYPPIFYPQNYSDNNSNFYPPTSQYNPTQSTYQNDINTNLNNQFAKSYASPSDYYNQSNQNLDIFSPVNNYTAQQDQIANKKLCDHEELQWVSSGTPINKQCSCGKLVTHNYYYCKTCDKYTCVECSS